jgi:hypothetical protein
MDVERLKHLEKFGSMLSRMIELNDDKLLELMKECGLPTQSQVLFEVKLTHSEKEAER